MPTEKQYELYMERQKKLDKLKQSGIDPYPAKASCTHQIAQALKNFSSLAKAKKKITLCGRIRAIRLHGALAFGNLEDGSAKIQFLLREGELKKEKFASFQKYFDLGDFVELSGILMETQRREKTLLVKNYTILAKTLRALPEKWHGLSDIETRLRKRYLDMLADPEVREIFSRKAKFWQALRGYLEKAGFLEVDTPALEDVPGGADANPFVTHHDALDRDFYLRISLELPLKKLLVGGFEKVYEVGKVFRNEGISAEHLQDYIECEFYWAYADYEDLMKFVESLYKHIVKKTMGSLKTSWNGQTLDWGRPWPRLDYFELFKKETGINLTKTTDEYLKAYAKNLGVVIEKGWGRGRIIDNIYKKQIRPQLIQPAFLINHPVEVSPLAKRNPKLVGRVERIQVLAAGSEVGNGWSELNDPVDQRERFERQMALREAGDREAQMLDESFVEALEYGMPPAAGFGLSERLFAVLMDKPIREIVVFPPMRKGSKI